MDQHLRDGPPGRQVLGSMCKNYHIQNRTRVQTLQDRILAMVRYYRNFEETSLSGLYRPETVIKLYILGGFRK